MGTRRKSLFNLRYLCMAFAAAVILMINPLRVKADTLNILTLSGDATYSNAQLAAYDEIRLSGYTLTVTDNFTTSAKVILGTDGKLIVNGNMTANNYVNCERGELTVDGNYEQRDEPLYVSASLVKITGNLTVSSEGYLDSNSPTSDIYVDGNIEYTSYSHSWFRNYNLHLKGNITQYERSGDFRLSTVILEGTGQQTLTLMSNSVVDGINAVNTNVKVVGPLNGTKLYSNFSPAMDGDLSTTGFNLNGFALTLPHGLSSTGTITLGQDGKLTVNGDMTANYYVHFENGTVTVNGNYTQTADGFETRSSEINVTGNLTMKGFFTGNDVNTHFNIGGDLIYDANYDHTFDKSTWTVGGNLEQKKSAFYVYYLLLPNADSRVSFVNGYIETLELSTVRSAYRNVPDDCYRKLIAVSTVSFDANGGSVNPGSKTVKTFETYGDLPIATRSGYTFDGWFTAAEGGTQIASDTVVEAVENSTLYAHWTAGAGPDFSIFNVADGCAMQARMYNPNSGEHFYTGSIEEVQNLINAGWDFEGPGFITPTVGIPIYRLYSEEHGDHFYTTDENERDLLVADGWKLEGENNGIAFPSASAGEGVPMYRLMNPNAYPSGKAGAHHFTAGLDEVENLKNAGWIFEGIAWYSL